MLVMTLKEGDYLMLGDDIRIQFLQDLSAKHMSVGITAPRSVNIVRGKPYEKRLAEEMEQNGSNETEVKLAKVKAQKETDAIQKQRAREKQREKLLAKKAAGAEQQ